MTVAVTAAVVLAALGFLAAGALATGGCSTDGDVGVCVTWVPNHFATHLSVAVTSGTVSSFEFDLPGGTSVVGVAGNSNCHNGPGDVVCTGDGGSVDIISNPTPSLGDEGTLTVKDGSGNAQPPVTVTEQSGSVSSSTSTTTAPTTTAPRPCKPGLTVTKDGLALGSGHALVLKNGAPVNLPTGTRPNFSYAITVRNASDCAADDVAVTDSLPSQFSCVTGVVIPEGSSGSHAGAVACVGAGVTVHEVIGTIPPHAAVVVAVFGSFTSTGEVTNVAMVDSSNGGEKLSNAVTFDVTHT